jgi:hypothetical protein
MGLTVKKRRFEGNVMESLLNATLVIVERRKDDRQQEMRSHGVPSRL